MHLLEKPLFVSLFVGLFVSRGTAWRSRGGAGSSTSSSAGRSRWTLEHIPKAISYNIATAPRRFRLRGWREGSDAAPVDFGEHEYSLETALQTFSLAHVPPGQRLVDAVRFELVSNWGYEAYTCLYRLRVHGEAP